MQLTVDDLYSQALLLPDESKESLAERLMAYLASRADLAVEEAQLTEVRRRLQEYDAGDVEPLQGEAVLARARKIVGR